MRVEALYRDGHKESVLCDEYAKLKDVVELAQEAYPVSKVKFLKVVPHGSTPNLDR